MATPMSAAQFVKTLKAGGCRVVELPGWATHNRNHKGAWGPVNGVMIHHTGSNTSSPKAYAKNVLYDGYAGLPGPLCHTGGAKDGTLYLTGMGRANHAGGGDPEVLKRVIAESYSGTLDPRRGNNNGVDGNSRFYGLEIMYSGGSAPSAAQYDAAVRFAAAICKFHGWSAKSVIGHGEWSSDKWDPGHVDMTKFRADVQKRLDGATTPTPKPQPTTPAKDWLDMATEAEVRKIIREELAGQQVTRSPNAPATVYKGKKSVLTTSALARVWSVAEAILKGQRARVRRPSHLPDNVYAGQADFSHEQAQNRSWTVNEATLKEVRELRELVEAGAEKDGLPVASLLAKAQPLVSEEVPDETPEDAADETEEAS